jgi:uncharacterized protein
LLAIVLLAFFIFFVVPNANAYDGPVVIDDANYLDGEQLLRLEHEVNLLNAESDFFLVVFTVPTLDGQNIELYAKAIMKTWKIGREGRDDGLLLLVVRDETRFYFRAGEDAKDEISAEHVEYIKTDILLPSFRKAASLSPLLQREEYLAGMIEAVKALGSEETGTPLYSFIWLIPPVLILIVVFSNTLNRKRRTCPHCGRQVSPLVSKCPHCLGDLRVQGSEPCPCGSRKPYEECCLDRHTDGRESHRIQVLRMLDIRYLMWQSTSFGGYTGGGPGELPPVQVGAKRFDGTGVEGRF